MIARRLLLHILLHLLVLVWSAFICDQVAAKNYTQPFDSNAVFEIECEMLPFIPYEYPVELMDDYNHADNDDEVVNMKLQQLKNKNRESSNYNHNVTAVRAQYKLTQENAKREVPRWMNPFYCLNTHSFLQFHVNDAELVQCHLYFGPKQFEFIQKSLQSSSSLSCRIPYSADFLFYVPLSISFWGIVEPTHFHINTQMNFIFHINEGRIIGAAVYAIRSRFAEVVINSTLQLYGTVKWFEGSSYSSAIDIPSVVPPAIGAKPSVSQVRVPDQLPNALSVIGWSIFSALLTCVCCAALYQFHFKPQLINKYLKND